MRIRFGSINRDVRLRKHMMPIARAVARVIMTTITITKTIEVTTVAMMMVMAVITRKTIMTTRTGAIRTFKMTVNVMADIMVMRTVRMTTTLPYLNRYFKEQFVCRTRWFQGNNERIVEG